MFSRISFMLQLRHAFRSARNKRLKSELAPKLVKCSGMCHICDFRQCTFEHGHSSTEHSNPCICYYCLFGPDSDEQHCVTQQSHSQHAHQFFNDSRSQCTSFKDEVARSPQLCTQSSSNQCSQFFKHDQPVSSFEPTAGIAAPPLLESELSDAASHVDNRAALHVHAPEFFVSSDNLNCCNDSQPDEGTSFFAHSREPRWETSQTLTFSDVPNSQPPSFLNISNN